MHIEIRQKLVNWTLEVHGIDNLSVRNGEVTFSHMLNGRPTFDKFRIEDLKEFRVVL